MKINKRNYFPTWLSVIAAAVVLVSCGGNSNSSDTAVPRQSAAVLEDYLKAGLNQSSRTMPMIQAAPVAAIAEDSAGASESFNATSETNTQEAGVDELNWLKNDTQYIFAYGGDSGGNIYGIPEVAIEDDSVTGLAVIDDVDDSAQIKVYRMEDGEIAAPLVNSLATEGFIQGLYLSERNDAGRSDQLIIVSTGDFDETVNRQGGQSWDYWSWRQQGIGVEIYDVADPARKIDKQAELTIEGSLVSSRRIGNQLYLVSRYTSYVPDLVLYPYTDEQVAANEALLEEVELQALLPRIRINGEVQALATEQNCYVPESTLAGNPTLLTVTAINLENPDDFKVSCIAAYAATVYVSSENVYVVSSSSQVSDIVWMWDNRSESSSVSSTIHRFELSSNGPIYRGEGAVKGEIGWDKQFRLSEYDGHLRVVTSAWGDYLGLGDNFKNDFTHSVHTLVIENEGLRSLATLPNESHPERIGKPGESLYSARFFKDKAYLVTFRRTDPFYVIDLSEAVSPVVLGELQMPGYSSYLQPIGDDLILGVGRDANEDGRVLGVKVGLFDVSVPSEPRLLNEYIVGEAGSSSAAEHDHKAITLLQSDQGSQWRLTLPVSVSEEQSYHWSYDGLLLFNITTADHPDEASLSRQGLMMSAEADQQNYYSRSWSYHRGSVLNADTVHYFDGSSLWSANWNNLQNMIGPQ